VKVVVPAYELHGNFAMLECQYELNNSDNRHSKSSKYHFPYDSNEQSDEGETLYSVKWYKDNEEFYRYVPKANPPQHSYRVDGIKVDVSIMLTPKLLCRYYNYMYMSYLFDDKKYVRYILTFDDVLIQILFCIFSTKHQITLRLS